MEKEPPNLATLRGAPRDPDDIECIRGLRTKLAKAERERDEAREELAQRDEARDWMKLAEVRLDLAHTEALLIEAAAVINEAADAVEAAERERDEARADADAWRERWSAVAVAMGDREDEVWRSGHDLAERVAAMRRERDDLRKEITEVRESLRRAGSVGGSYLTRAERAEQRVAALEEALRQMREAGGRLRARLKGRGHSRSCHIYPAGGKCSCYYDSDCLAWDRAAALAQKDESK